MSTLALRDVRDLLPAPPDRTTPADHGTDGFLDCRGVFHAWSEEDD